MFKVVEVKDYDVHERYGTDWHTDYHIETDEDLNIDEVIEKLRVLGYNAYGSMTLKKKDNQMVLETVMY